MIRGPLLLGVVFMLIDGAAQAIEPRFAPLPSGLVAEGAGVSVAARTSFLEGPAFDADGTLYFSDLIGNTIYTMAPGGALRVFRAESGRTNGNTFDAQGRLISCEGAEHGPNGRRRMVRTDLKTGKVEVLAEKYEGKRFNAPNDACVDVKGRVWFTDPYYGEDRAMLEMGVEAVYRIDPDGAVARVIAQPAIERPNGIAITPDAKTLYLIDSHPRPGGNRKIWAFDVTEAGVPVLRSQRLVYDFGRGRGGDGMRLDVTGNLWVCAGISVPRTSGETADVPTGVYVITPQGTLLGRIPIPEDVITNLAFGGPDKKLLHVVSGKSVFRVPVNVPGYSLFP